jgi:hypothetical protein
MVERNDEREIGTVIGTNLQWSDCKSFFISYTRGFLLHSLVFYTTHFLLGGIIGKLRVGGGVFV